MNLQVNRSPKWSGGTKDLGPSKSNSSFPQIVNPIFCIETGFSEPFVGAPVDSQVYHTYDQSRVWMDAKVIFPLCVCDTRQSPILVESSVFAKQHFFTILKCRLANMTISFLHSQPMTLAWLYCVSINLETHSRDWRIGSAKDQIPIINAEMVIRPLFIQIIQVLWGKGRWRESG